jgi:15-cis-phytoene synthase
MPLTQFTEIFKRGSTTYFYSSLFFPTLIRRRVTVLYAFVRLADDYVDQIPQDKTGFYAFWEEFKRARSNQLNSLQGSGDSNQLANFQSHLDNTTSQAIEAFAALEKELGFDPGWADAFLKSMEMDLTKNVYENLAETEEYIYGSANVIGLFMSRMLGLPKAAEKHAESLGKAMQYINFIRDIAEDLDLGRNYFPQTEYRENNISDLQPQTTAGRPKEYSKFLQSQLEIYKKWQREGEAGFAYIPKNFLVPIKTASDLYKWTAYQIQKHPFEVYKRKIKPSKRRILRTTLWNWLVLPKTNSSYPAKSIEKLV